jgi:hypothetical protein
MIRDSAFRPLEKKNGLLRNSRKTGTESGAPPKGQTNSFLVWRRASAPFALTAITVGGLIAGTLDLTQACILFGWKIPLAIAGGLLGPQAFHGGIATYILGVLLHFFIAFSATAIYYAASRRLGFLTEHALVCGLFYGVAVELVMRLIVLPLSALHARGPYQRNDLIQGLLVHMVVIGLPISFSVRRFAQNQNENLRAT